MTPAAFIVAELRDGRPVAFLARGWSMWPGVRDGATIEAVPCPIGELRAGDIAVYEHGSQVFVHRVIGVGPAGLSCCGDSLGPPYEHVEAERVLGRARLVRQAPLRWWRARPRHARWAFRALRENLRAHLRRHRPNKQQVDPGRR